MNLAQGVEFLESVPWKLIAIPSIALGFVIAFFDSFTNYRYKREDIRLQRDMRNLLVLLSDDSSRTKECVESIDETLLERAGYKPYRAPSAKEPELPRIGGAG